MSFFISGVRVQNFRTHTERTLYPEASGVTVIQGANGTGKSSLVDSIAWGLFGIKPPGVGKNSDLKRSTAKDKDNVCVQLEIVTGEGEHYLIERRLLGKKCTAECDVWIAHNETDNNKDNDPQSTSTQPYLNLEELEVGSNKPNHCEHVAGPAVSHVNAYIRNVTGTTEKGFLTSMFVQQKQVDELLTASAKNRALVIEKMTGITALTDALTDIRSDVRAAKKNVDFLGDNVNNDNIEDIEKDISEMEKSLGDKNKEYKEVVNAGKTTRKELDEVEALRDELKNLVREVESKRSQLNIVEESYSAISRRAKRLKADNKDKEQQLSDKEAELEKVIDTEDGAGDLDTIIDNRNATQSLVSTYEQHMSHGKREVSRINRELSDCLEEVRTLLSQESLNVSSSDDTDDDNVDMKAHVDFDTITLMVDTMCYTVGISGEKEIRNTKKEAALAELEKLKEYVQKTLRGLRELHDLVDSRVQATEKDIDTLTENVVKIKNDLDFNRQIVNALGDTDGKCPTCHQKPDNVHELVYSAQDRIDELIDEGHKVSENKKTLKRTLVGYQEHAEHVSECARKLKSVVSLMSDIVDNCVSVASAYEKCREEKHKMKYLNEAYKLAEDIKSIRFEVSTYRSRMKEYKKEASETKESTAALTQEIEGLEKELNIKTQGQDYKKFVDNVENDYTSLRDKLETLREEKSTVKEEKAGLETSLEYRNKDLQRVKRVQEQYKEAVEKSEELSSSASMVSDFRAKRIEEVIPEISFVASELLQRFTDGKLVELELNKDYKAKVETSSGDTYDVGMLSGGELSAVALALRLAIAIISQDSQGNGAVILDEVLVSQDENRVHNIVETFKDVLQGQVVLIGHNGNVISSIADKTVEIKG